MTEILTEPSLQEEVLGEGRWWPDPLGRFELRWWDGTAWTSNVSSSGETSVDPEGSTSPSKAGAASLPNPNVPAEQESAPETWQTRRESIGTFLFNVFLCGIFPFVALWYGPKYALRQQYLRSFVCVATAVTMIVVVLSLTAGSGT